MRSDQRSDRITINSGHPAKRFGLVLGFAAIAIAGGGRASASSLRLPEAETPLTTPAAPQQIAQATVTNLSEIPRLVNACRYSPNGNLDVFADAAQTQRLFTLFNPNTQVTLTGVVGTSIAQIKTPALGWIGTLTVEPCYTPTPAPTPAPTPPPISNRACYRIVRDRLTARTGPGTDYQALGDYQEGATAYATSNPPREQVDSDGRIWVQVDAPNGVGWIARTGKRGRDDNAVRLADNQCN